MNEITSYDIEADALASKGRQTKLTPLAALPEALRERVVWFTTQLRLNPIRIWYMDLEFLFLGRSYYALPFEIAIFDGDGTEVIHTTVLYSDIDGNPLSIADILETIKPVVSSCIYNKARSTMLRVYGKATTHGKAPTQIRAALDAAGFTLDSMHLFSWGPPDVYCFLRLYQGHNDISFPLRMLDLATIVNNLQTFQPVNMLHVLRCAYPNFPARFTLRNVYHDFTQYG